MSDWRPPSREGSWRTKVWRDSWLGDRESPRHLFDEGNGLMALAKAYGPKGNYFKNSKTWIEGEQTAFWPPWIPKPHFLKITPEKAKQARFLIRLRARIAGVR